MVWQNDNCNATSKKCIAVARPGYTRRLSGDRKAYSQAQGSSISYYHDRYDLEADTVLHLEDGRYALIEFKLGGSEVEEGAKHLVEIKRLVKEFNKTTKNSKLREPDLMLVITGGPIAYSRPDDVKVIPLACLRD